MKPTDVRNNRLHNAIMAKFSDKAVHGSKHKGYDTFATAVGMSPQLVSFIVHQHRKLPSDAKKRWAECLDCEVLDIFIKE